MKYVHRQRQRNRYDLEDGPTHSKDHLWPSHWSGGPSAAAKAEGVKKTAIGIALKGGKQSHRTYVATWSPYCDTPVTVYRSVRPNTGGSVPGMETVMEVPCRKCERCVQFRSMQWRERIEHEIRISKRSWWITLTFNEVALANIMVAARLLPESKSLDQRIDRVAYGHLQRMLKRLRKAGNQFRFFAVFEKGEKTGRAHYHMILHEIGDRPITKRAIEAEWPSIIHTRLVDEERRGLSSYLVKYTTKSLDIAPRASLRYGQDRAAELNEVKKDENKKVSLFSGSTSTPPFFLSSFLATEEESGTKVRGNLASQHVPKGVQGEILPPDNISNGDETNEHWNTDLEVLLPFQLGPLDV